jgi:two-component system, chemotaxis family, protein-glutamate methylesterase/glutaminase
VSNARYEIAVVGTSWGGLAALRELVSCLPADLPIPVVLVQHRHKHSDGALPQLLQDRTRLRVCEVEDKTPIEPGAIYVAPADYHLLVEPDYFTLSVEEPIRYSRPSIDLTFSSAADVFGPKTIGVILTGANADGTAGLKRIAERGGATLVQEPATAESPAMPTSALQAVPSSRTLTIGAIGGAIADLARLQEKPRASWTHRAGSPEPATPPERTR